MTSGKLSLLRDQIFSWPGQLGSCGEGAVCGLSKTQAWLSLLTGMFVFEIEILDGDWRNQM
jgi:hypothetical protein